MGVIVDKINALLASLGFNNPGALSLFNKVSQGIGLTIETQIQEFTNSENRILNTITTQRYGKDAYYTGAAKAFQYGDDLVVDPVTLDYVYAVINPQNQIISQAAFEEIESGQNVKLFLKIATLDQLSGNLEKLTDTQLAAFTAYFLLYQIPGLPITIVNSDPDVLSFSAICTYMATYDRTKLQTNVNNALATFRQTFAFDGVFYTGDLDDYVKQNVPGVRDFYTSSTQLNGNSFGGSTTLPAGYFNFDANSLNSIVYRAI